MISYSTSVIFHNYDLYAVQKRKLNEQNGQNHLPTYSFFVNVSGSFKMASTNVEIGQRVPQQPDLIGVTFDALSNDGVDVQRANFVGIFTYQLTKFIPQLKWNAETLFNCCEVLSWKKQRNCRQCTNFNSYSFLCGKIEGFHPFCWIILSNAKICVMRF